MYDVRLMGPFLVSFVTVYFWRKNFFNVDIFLLHISRFGHYRIGLLEIGLFVVGLETFFTASCFHGVTGCLEKMRPHSLVQYCLKFPGRPTADVCTPVFHHSHF